MTITTTKKIVGALLLFVVALLVTLAWGVHFHNDWVAGKLPQWGWLQAGVHFLGPAVEAPVAEDEDPDNTKNEIPVHVAQVTVGTVHRYIEGFGIVTPRPPRSANPGAPAGAGSASIAAPVPGIVAKVACEIGQKVRAGDLLIQLDDRLAASAQDQAQAALAEAQAALALLQAPPRADQLQITQLGVEKADAALDFARRNLERQKTLATDQGTSGKNFEQAQLDFAAAENDREVARRQLALLKAGATPQELQAAQAKVQGASAALATARQQREMLAIHAPIDATVVAIPVNAGESVDTTRVLVQLIAMDRLMVDVDVPADELPADAAGLNALVTLGTGKFDPAKALSGKVAFVSPQVEPKNGSVMVGIDLAPDVSSSTTLRPGLTVRVRIIAQEHKDVLLVPHEAVVADENLDHVIAIVDGEQAKHHTVTTGLEENGMTEISGDDAVHEGTTVVTQGAFGLRETQQTRIKVVD